MSTVAKATTKKAEKLPTPPKTGGAARKKGKAWIAKRADNVKRVLKVATTLKERFTPVAAAEARPEFKDKLTALSLVVASIHANAAEALKQVAVLESTAYEPAGGAGRGSSVKLANGAQVWLRGKVWLKKYKGLYQPAELDGLTISNIVGKKAMAKATGGTQVVEPLNAFTTTPVNYDTVAEAA